MNPGAWFVSVATHRLLMKTLVALAAVFVLAGVLFVLVLAGAGPSVDGPPAGDLLLAPFRWVTIAERGLA